MHRTVCQRYSSFFLIFLLSKLLSYKTQSSAIADKLCDVFVQYNDFQVTVYQMEWSWIVLLVEHRSSIHLVSESLPVIYTSM